MQDQIEIKQLNINDWQRFKKIRLEALREEPDAYSTRFDDVKDSDDSYWKEKFTDTNNTILVAESTNNVIAMLRITLNDPDVDKDCVYLVGLYVSKNFRRLGIATKLIDHACKMLSDNPNINKVALSVRETQKDALGLYNKLGFTKIRSIEEKVDDNVVREYLVQKIL